MNSASLSLAEMAQHLRETFLQRSFGAIRFWRFAVVRPHDQAFRLTEIREAGDRLELVLCHDSGEGQPGVLSLWSPTGVAVTPQGLTVQQAERLRLDDNEAWTAGENYGIRTPRGEGAFPINGAPALTLEI
ncbi:MAG: hypothetical protein RIR00_1048 [Pseudomonadota bacterium]|jgi:hypothetical protein